MPGTSTNFGRYRGIPVLLALVILCAPGTRAQAGKNPTPPRSHALRVAPPTGDPARDHANILAAFKRARPGDTIVFSPGIYVVGKIIQVPTPRLKLLGSPKGTVLRGCTPEGYEKLKLEERELFRKIVFGHGPPHPSRTVRARAAKLVRQCGMFQLTGGHDTVRNLTFGYTRIGLVLGHGYQHEYRSSAGGYVVEGNTFRDSNNGIRAGVWSSDPTTIRHNTFVDTYHAVMTSGNHLRVLDNLILAPSPIHVPGDEVTSLALSIVAMNRGTGGASSSARESCNDNVIEGNVIDGYPSGIMLAADPGTSCRGNIIRDNTISVRRVPLPPTSILAGSFPLTDKTDPSYVGTPIRLQGNVMYALIEGNRILGAEGYGIAVMHASENRIAGNTIAGVLVRKPFPGNTGTGPWSRKANGSGIWVSTGSEGNEISGNHFHDIAANCIFLEGDRNSVRIARASDSVRDLGTGNHVTGPRSR